MAIIDVVKWDEETYLQNLKSGSDPSPMDQIYAWKFPSTELSTWTQLIVHESQEAVLFRGGSMDGPYGPGRHVLKTENIPIISELLKLPFGRSPFTAEVWYTNKAIPLNISWGFGLDDESASIQEDEVAGQKRTTRTTQFSSADRTSSDDSTIRDDAIRILDPKFKIAVPVLARGQYAVQIEHSRKFLVKLVGVLAEFNQQKLKEYFRGMIQTIAKTVIARSLLEKDADGQEKSVLFIATELINISAAIEKELRASLDEFGLRLVNFTVSHIDVKKSDPSIQKLQEALARKAEMDIVGFSYQQERQFNALEGAAGFTGASGNTLNNFINHPPEQSGVAATVIGAGVGLGVGIPMAQAMMAQTQNAFGANGGMMPQQPYHHGMPPHQQAYNPGMQPPQQAYNPGMQPPQQAYNPGMQPPQQGYNPGMQPPQQAYNPGMQPPQQGYNPGTTPSQQPYNPGMQAPPGGAQSQVSAMEKLKMLESMANMRAQGLITEEEFLKFKSSLF